MKITQYNRTPLFKLMYFKVALEKRDLSLKKMGGGASMILPNRKLYKNLSINSNQKNTNFKKGTYNVKYGTE